MKIPEHPTTIIKRDYIELHGLSYEEIQKYTGVDAGALKVFLEKKRYLHSLDAIRLARFFGEGDGYFVFMQAIHRASQEINGITRKKAQKLNRIPTLTEVQVAGLA